MFIRISLYLLSLSLLYTITFADKSIPSMKCTRTEITIQQALTHEMSQCALKTPFYYESKDPPYEIVKMPTETERNGICDECQSFVNLVNYFNLTDCGPKQEAVNHTFKTYIETIVKDCTPSKVESTDFGTICDSSQIDQFSNLYVRTLSCIPETYYPSFVGSLGPVGLPSEEQIEQICTDCSKLIYHAQTQSYPDCILPGMMFSIGEVMNAIYGSCEAGSDTGEELFQDEKTGSDIDGSGSQKFVDDIGDQSSSEDSSCWPLPYIHPIVIMALGILVW